jgi:nitrate/nitrite transport system substrate-binding protein
MSSNWSRRDVVRTLALGAAGTAGAGLLAACSGEAKADTKAATSGAGSATAADRTIKLGIIPLTDCASVVMAHELGLFKKRGLSVTVEKQTSWPVVRDKLASGELHGAHCLFGMPFAAATKVSELRGDPLRIAMVLNNNGQATTLSSKTFGGKVGYGDYTAFKKAVDAARATKEPTFAMTFPGGTHDVWLHLMLAASGIDPKSVKVKPIPPPQMVANMEAGNMDGYNVGEPWGGVAAKKGVGFTFIATQTMWKHHPEKAFVVGSKFAEERRDDLKKLMSAILEASKWMDDMGNRAQAAKVIGSQQYVYAPADVIDARLMGNYDLGGGLGSKTFTDDTMLFHRDGATNFPRYSHGIWFMTQYARFGRLPAVPADAEQIARTVILQDLYREVAKESGVAVPDDDMKPFTVQADKVEFDPKNPGAALPLYAAAFREAGGVA